MKFLKITAVSILGYLLSAQQAFAVCIPTAEIECPGIAVPEIDGSGAVLAIGLVAGLAMLVREKFYK